MFSDFTCLSTCVCLHLNSLIQLMSHRIGCFSKHPLMGMVLAFDMLVPVTHI